MNNKKINKNKKMADFASTIFLIFMFTVFPLWLDDGYLNITATKYYIFMIAGIIYAIIMAMILLLRFTDARYYRDKVSINDKTDKMKFLPSDLFMLLFLLSGFTAWLMADNKSNAFSGEMGRRCGFAFIIVVALVYFALSSGYCMSKIVMPVFAVASALVFLMAILQFSGLDVFGLLSEISASQRTLFVSTLGNINVFAGFTVLAVALFAGLFIFEAKTAFKILYGIVVFIGGFAVLAAKSDLTYAGISACLITLLLVSEYKGKISDFLFMLFLLLSGYTVMLFVINQMDGGAEQLTGLNNTFNHTGIWAAACGAVLLAWILCKLICRRQINSKDKLKKLRSSTLVIVTACAIAALITVVIIAGILNKWDIFEFNDYWGNYRGYIWSRLIELYKDFPLLNKIFGNGNETVYELMYVNYYDEMYELTGWVYDNAHNQYLQYLVTMGIFGVISYIGLIGASVCNCIKMSKDNVYAFPVMTVIIAFAVQEFFNIGQPVTTPFMFLFIAIAAGLRRRQKV